MKFKQFRYYRYFANHAAHLFNIHGNMLSKYMNNSFNSKKLL